MFLPPAPHPPPAPRAGEPGAAGPMVGGKWDQAPEAAFVSDKRKTTVCDLSGKCPKLRVKRLVNRRMKRYSLQQ